MAQAVQRTTKTTSANGDVTTTREAPASPVRSGQNVLTNIIWLLFGILLILLALRFLFALLGANPSNGFANFVYSTSHPFVAPFFGLFNYNYHYGISKFETYTLVAIVVYAVVAWILTTLVNINRPQV